MLEYKGYLGAIEYDAHAKLFHGDIININNVIAFQCTSVKEIESAFINSINNYLAWCMKEGVEPEKPCSGTGGALLPQELRRHAAIPVKKKYFPPNSFIGKASDNEISLLCEAS